MGELALVYFKFFLVAFLYASTFCLALHYLGGLEYPGWVEMHGALVGGTLGGLWFGYSLCKSEEG